MPKFDALSLLARKAPVETREFTDPCQPGKVLQLSMKAPDFTDFAMAGEIAEYLVKTWIEQDSGSYVPWPPPGLGLPPIRWSRRLCQVLGMIEAFQCPEDPEDAYDAAELAIISVHMPKAWDGVAAWVDELQKATGEPGNASAAREETSCAPPVTEEETIPSSGITCSTFSGASTSGSREMTALTFPRLDGSP